MEQLCYLILMTYLFKIKNCISFLCQQRFIKLFINSRPKHTMSINEEVMHVHSKLYGKWRIDNKSLKDITCMYN